MVAAVESMAFVGEVPWHGLGNRLAGEATRDVDSFITAAGLDWAVGLTKLFTSDTHPILGRVEVPNRGVYRKDKKGGDALLGVVGPTYTPLQNRDAFAWFQPFIDAGLATFHTAGSLFDGRKVWVMAELAGGDMEVRPGDHVKRFLMISNSHDGTSAVRVGFTPVRVVCANTLAAAHGNADSKLVRLRHTKGMAAGLNDLREAIDVANQEFSATLELYRKLANRAINQDDLRKYVRLVLNVEEPKSGETMHGRTANRIDKLVQLAFAGRGNGGGTFWDAYNGVTEFLSHEYGRDQENRVNALWFGDSREMSARALKIAAEMAA